MQVYQHKHILQTVNYNQIVLIQIISNICYLSQVLQKAIFS
jgi:hypothetical protein